MERLSAAASKRLCSATGAPSWNIFTWISVIFPMTLRSRRRSWRPTSPRGLPAACATTWCASVSTTASAPALGSPTTEFRGRGSLRHGLFGLLGALALVGVEVLLAQADRFRRHLDELVVLDIGERLFQRHLDRWRQAHRLILRRGADVGELLALEHVDLEIVVAGVLADDHAAIDLPARLDHHRAAVFQLEHGIGHRIALVVGDQHAVAAALDLALVGCIAVEQAVHDRGAAGVGEKLTLIADQAAGRRVEYEPQAVAAGRSHFN